MHRVLIMALLAMTIICGCGGGATSSNVTSTSASSSSSGGVPPAPAPAITSLSISPSTAFGFPGTSTQLNATGVLSNGTTKDITQSVTWSSATPSIATVSNVGQVTAITSGQATIRATAASGATASATFNVSNAGADFTTRDSGIILNGVTFGNGIYIACGGQNIYRSTDATKWTADIANPSNTIQWTDVAFGNGLFALAGTTTISTSADGVNWTVRLNDGNFFANRIVFLNGQFVAVGASNTNQNVYTSPDGITWTPHNGNIFSLSDVTFGNGTYVTIGFGGAFATSTDGATWTAAALPANTFTGGVIFANNQFVAIGSDGLANVDVLTSPDGSTWTATPNPSLTPNVNLLVTTSIAFLQGRYVVVTPQGVVTSSTDLATFVPINLSPPALPLAVRAVNGRFIAVGFQSAIAVSTDGLNFNVSNYGALFGSLQSVTFGKNLYVAAGTQGGIVTSPDARTWTQRATPFSSVLFFAQFLTGVTFGNGAFVSVGASLNTSTALILTSADAIGWATQSPAFAAGQSGVAFGQKLFVSVGLNGTVQTSPDGIAWTARGSNTANNLNAVTFANGLFVAVGENGRVITSPDGINWNVQTSSTSQILRGVAGQAGTFFAVGDNGTIIKSSDAITWTTVSSGTTNALSAAFTGNGLFVAAGNQGTLLTSPDATTWTLRATHTNFQLFGGTFNNGQFVVVGGDGGTSEIILSSP